MLVSPVSTFSISINLLLGLLFILIAQYVPFTLHPHKTDRVFSMAKSETGYSCRLNPSNDSGSGIDRISNLPAPLHSRILSLLPTRFAVETSVLSTRWKFLWTTVTNLDFEDWSCSLKDLDMQRIKFTQFVNRVLILVHQHFIQNFRLACGQQHYDPFYFNVWICAAIERTIGELQLSLTLEKPIALPLCQLHCKTLSVLNLRGNIHFNIPAQASVCFPSLHTVFLCGTRLAISRNSIVSFPSLKILHICCSEFTNEDSVHKLFSSCPVLDELFLKSRCRDNVLCLIIRIPSLTSLTLRFSFRDPLYKLQMETPALQYLNIHDTSMKCEYLPAKNLSSLLQASVRLETFDLRSCISIFRFIESLSNVQRLSILGHALRMIRTAPAKLSQGFHNLTRLELEKNDCRDWSFVINDLLETMDKLDHLIMKGAGYCCGGCHSWWTEPLNVPRCLLSRISTISFRNITGDCHDELELVRYFLKNAKVLVMMEVRYSV